MSRPKRDSRTGSLEFYKEFKERYPKYNISYKEYVSILKYYNLQIANHVLDTGQKIKLPWGIGELCINKYKRKVYKIDSKGEKVYNYKIDFQKSKELGKKVYHLNLHTDGYQYHWFWSTTTSKIKYARIWSLTMAREHSRELVRRLKLPTSQYKDLYRMFQRRRKKRF